MTICPTCRAEWDRDELMKAGKIASALCQHCGYDPRLHGPADFADKVWAPDEWWVRQL